MNDKQEDILRMSKDLHREGVLFKTKDKIESKISSINSIRSSADHLKPRMLDQ